MSVDNKSKKVWLHNLVRINFFNWVSIIINSLVMWIRNAVIDFGEGLGLKIERDAIAGGDVNRRAAADFLRIDINWKNYGINQLNLMEDQQ